MITLSKSGGTVTFTFDDNSTYLQNGTIEVPLNSLSLIIDESGMATFRKSASNDIFVSALYSEFGMSKAELEAWYKENMVGSAGIDSGAVQTQIDESISGKQDTLIAGEHITISGNVISAEAGTVPYDGYSTIEIFTGSTMGLDKIETPFYVVSGSRFCFEYKGNGEQPWGDYTCALLDWTNHTSSFQEQGAEEFVSVTWDAKYNAFKFDTLQEGHDITYVSGRNWGYPKTLIPSGTTNETFDNVIEYVADSDNTLNSKFGNYLTTSAASNTYIAKSDSIGIKFTQDMFEREETNINGGLISIQDGYDNYYISTPWGTNYGLGIFRESFVLGIGAALGNVLWGSDESVQTDVFGISQAEVFNGGLNGRVVMVIWDSAHEAAIYFKCQNSTITSGQTTQGEEQIEFNLSGKMYYDAECTKQYKTRPNWNVGGTVKDVNGIIEGWFSANQLEMDGFFGNKSQNQGVFYDENGGEHYIPDNFYIYNPNNEYGESLGITTLCYIGSIGGEYKTYSLNGSLTENVERVWNAMISDKVFSLTLYVQSVNYDNLSQIGMSTEEIQTLIDDSIVNKADKSELGFNQFDKEDWLNDNYQNFTNRFVKIQNGYNDVVLGTPNSGRWSPYVINSVGKGIVSESYPFAVGYMMVALLSNAYTPTAFGLGDITVEEILNDGLNEKVLFNMKAGYNQEVTVYFKVDSYTLTSGDTVDFEFNGHAYYDAECTKEYRSWLSSWYMSGSYSYESQRDTWKLLNGYFDFGQFNEDGFFGTDIANGAASLYGENGSRYTLANNGRVYCGNLSNYGVFIACQKLDTEPSGEYYKYISNGDIQKTIDIGVSTFSMGGFKNFEFSNQLYGVDYSKLEPLDFYYNIDNNSINSKGIVGLEWYVGDNFPSSDGDLKISVKKYGSYTEYTIAHYDATTREITYYDNETGNGTFNTEILSNGHRVTKLTDSSIKEHFTINPYGISLFRSSILYVHQLPKPTVIEGEITSALNSINERLIALEAAVQALQALHNNE